MKRLISLIIVFSTATAAYSQIQRPDVLVVGNSNTAVAAAIQSAQSGAKTILLLQSGGFDLNEPNDTLWSNVAATFAYKWKEEADSVPHFDKQTASRAMYKWTDSIKNLTVLKNVQWVKASRSGKNWTFKLSKGKNIKPEILVNVGDTRLNTSLKINLPAKNLWKDYTDGNKLYKTSVASGRTAETGKNHFVSLYDLIPQTQENLIYISELNSMSIGQAAGAVAAYSGFFDLNTSETNLRKTQAELLNFKAVLLPLKDISPADTNWKTIQMIALTGVIKPIDSLSELYFNPDENLATDIIRQPMKGHFYKAQIWFDDYKSPYMTLAASLDLIRYVGNKDAGTMRKEIEKKWTTAYHFKSGFNLDKIITRLEFAVILQDYASPFVVTIDKEGNILR